MKVTLKFYFSEFSYTAPIIVNRFQISKNRLLKIDIFNHEELISTLNLSALPHFHNYNVDEWKYTLDTFYTDRELDFFNIDLSKPFFNTTTSGTNYSGELLFIIESILFAVIERKYPQALSSIDKITIKVNALYSPDLELEDLPEYIKIKIRPTKENLDDTIAVIKNLKGKKTDILFRLDGNRSFEFSELVNFLNQIKREFGPLEQIIEYIEEPFKNYSDSYSLSNYSTIPVALDESLLLFIDQLSKIPKDSYVIVKPSLLGISKSFEILNLFKDKAVISSSYETKDSIRPMMYLAALNPYTFHGLDTLKFLPKDLSIKIVNFCLPF